MKISKAPLLFALSLVMEIGLTSSTTAMPVRIAWCSYLESNGALSSGSSFNFLGHSYVYFENLRSSPVSMGYITIPAHGIVTVGLWHTSPLDGHWASNTPGATIHSGIFYNLESNIFNGTWEVYDQVRVRKNIPLAKYWDIGQYLITKNDSYNLFTYNCATFATELWNLIFGTSFYTGIGRNPWAAKTDILSYATSQSTNYVPPASSFSQYDSSSGTMMDYYVV